MTAKTGTPKSKWKGKKEPAQCTIYQQIHLIMKVYTNFYIYTRNDTKNVISANRRRPNPKWIPSSTVSICRSGTKFRS